MNSTWAKTRVILGVRWLLWHETLIDHLIKSSESHGGENLQNQTQFSSLLSPQAWLVVCFEKRSCLVQTVMHKHCWRGHCVNKDVICCERLWMPRWKQWDSVTLWTLDQPAYDPRALVHVVNISRFRFQSASIYGANILFCRYYPALWQQSVWSFTLHWKPNDLMVSFPRSFHWNLVCALLSILSCLDSPHLAHN